VPKGDWGHGSRPCASAGLHRPGRLRRNWHIDAIAEHLEAVANGQCRRLIIMMPPRHMKSLSVNVAFPPWVWAQKKRSPLTGPGVGFLSTSYAQHLSASATTSSPPRDRQPWYQRGWGDRFSSRATRTPRSASRTIKAAIGSPPRSTAPRPATAATSSSSTIRSAPRMRCRRPSGPAPTNGSTAPCRPASTIRRPAPTSS
jgi:hypothetical protein